MTWSEITIMYKTKEKLKTPLPTSLILISFEPTFLHLACKSYFKFEKYCINE